MHGAPTKEIVSAGEYEEGAASRVVQGIPYTQTNTFLPEVWASPDRKRPLTQVALILEGLSTAGATPNPLGRSAIERELGEMSTSCLDRDLAGLPEASLPFRQWMIAWYLYAVADGQIETTYNLDTATAERLEGYFATGLTPVEGVGALFGALH
jgi:hypothetical protein